MGRDIESPISAPLRGEPNTGALGSPRIGQLICYYFLYFNTLIHDGYTRRRQY